MAAATNDQADPHNGGGAAETQDEQHQDGQKKDGKKQEDTPKKPMSLRTKLILGALLVVVLIALAAWLTHYELRGKYLESTNDAFVYADSVTIAPKISGYVEQVYVAENQVVGANQPLVRIDPREYAAQTAQSKAQIDVAAATVDQARAALHEQSAAIAEAKAQLDSALEDARFAVSEVERYSPLAASGAETRESLTKLRNQAAQAQATVAARRAALRAAQLKTDSLEAQIHQAQAQGESARAQYAAANVDLGSTEVRASVPGRVGDKQVRVGQFVAAGTRMLTLVPTDFYIVANFKETQIGMMRVGQPAVIKVDALPGFKFRGRVQSIAPGTGAQFSLLPPQNATGNFTKIVQRVPVRVAVDVAEEDRAVFVAGLSVDVEVDTIAAKDSVREQRRRNRADNKQAETQHADNRQADAEQGRMR